MISRRTLIAISGALGAVRALAGAESWFAGQDEADTYFEWQGVAEGVRVGWGDEGASLLVTSGDEALLVDCKGYGLGTTLRREAEAGGERLVAVVNTHHHSAQTGGNIAFTPDIEVIAQRRAGPRIVSDVESVLRALQQDPGGGLIAGRRSRIRDLGHSNEGSRQALLDFDAHVAEVESIVAGNFGPSTVFSGEHVLKVGSLEVQLHHFGDAHTDNDVVVWIPERRVAHVGNLVYIDAHPEVDAPRGGRIRSWQRCLDRIGELCGPEATIVPSDGRLLGTTHDVDTQSNYFDAVNALVQSAVDAGMSREETVDFIPSTGMGRFAGLAQPDRLAANLGIAYDEIIERG